MIHEKIYNHRKSLAKRFSKVADGHGKVTVEDWKKVMEKVTELKLEWDLILPYLAKVKKEKINYTEFIDRYSVPINDTILQGIVNLVCSQMFANKQNIQQFFDESDVDQDGKISFDEFLKALKQFNLGLSDDQLYDFMSSFDSDNDGQISFTEFEERFGTSLVNLQITDKWVVNAVKHIAVFFHSKTKSLKSYFDKYDTNKSNFVSRKEFSNMIKKYFSDLKLSKAQRHQLFDYIDINKKKGITFEEFSETFTIRDIKVDSWQYNVINQLYDTVRNNKSQLLGLFRHYDTNNDGHLDKSEFKLSLQALNNIRGKPLTTEQINILFKTFDKDKDNSINYNEFMDSFKVIVSDEGKEGKGKD